MGVFSQLLSNKEATMKIFIIAMLGVGLCLARDVRETFVDICKENSGNECCADDDQGMGTTDTRHTYWIDRSQGSWTDMDIACKTEKPGTTRLAVFESRREMDCVTKYLIDEYDVTSGQQYAIGIKVEDDFPGVYEWHGVDLPADNQAAATLAFTNWDPASPTGKRCVAMTVGREDPKNGRWTDVDCNAPMTLYGICEYTPPSGGRHNGPPV